MRIVRGWVVIAGLLGAVGVAVGAFAAHGLRPALERTISEPSEVARRMDLCQTAVRFQIMHAIVLLAIGLIPTPEQRQLWRVAAWTFVVGILLFCGALYAIVITGSSAWGAVAPFGGAALIAGWLVLAAAGVVSSPTRE